MARGGVVGSWNWAHFFGLQNSAKRRGAVGPAHGASRAPLFARRCAPPPRPIKSLAKPCTMYDLQAGSLRTVTRRGDPAGQVMVRIDGGVPDDDGGAARGDLVLFLAEIASDVDAASEFLL